MSLEDLHLHAVDYRTANTRDADIFWKELEKYVEEQLAKAKQAERDRCAAECKRLFGAGKKVNGVMFGTSALDCAEVIEQLK